MIKKIYLILVFILSLSINTFAFATSPTEQKIEPGIYVLVSFSMNDQALRSYFDEAQNFGARLVMRGFATDSNTGNMFTYTKAKLEQAKINIDINPVLFDELNIRQVPVIAVVKADGGIKKIAGHITLAKALELMGEEKK